MVKVDSKRRGLEFCRPSTFLRNPGLYWIWRDPEGFSSRLSKRCISRPLDGELESALPPTPINSIISGAGQHHIICLGGRIRQTIVKHRQDFGWISSSSPHYASAFYVTVIAFAFREIISHTLADPLYLRTSFYFSSSHVVNLSPMLYLFRFYVQSDRLSNGDI